MILPFLNLWNEPIPICFIICDTFFDRVSPTQPRKPARSLQEMREEAAMLRKELDNMTQESEKQKWQIKMFNVMKNCYGSFNKTIMI